MGRLKAAQDLQAALVSQFGTSARDTIEEEVAKHLGGRKRLTRQDLDAVEEGVLSKMRSQRLLPASRGVSRGSAASTEAGLLSRAHSVPSTLQPLMEGRTPSSPSRPFEASVSAAQRSGKLAVVPLVPKVKPEDCFDLFAEFNTAQFHLDAEAKKKELKAKAAAFRHGLDLQMDEVRAIRQKEADEKQRLKEEMLAQAKAGQEAAAAELAKEKERKELRRQASLELLACAARKRDAVAGQQRRERQAFDKTMMSQDSMANEEYAARQTGRAMFSKEMRSQYADAGSRKHRMKKEGKEADIRMAEEWARRTSGPTDSETPGGPMFKIKEGQARVDHIVSSMGVPIIEGMRLKVRAADERVERQRRAHERQRVDDYFKEQHEHSLKVTDMVQTWDKQLFEGSGHDLPGGFRFVAKGQMAKTQDARQAEVWRTKAEKDEQEERAKVGAKRQAEKDNQDAVFTTMVHKAGVHKSEKNVTDEFKQREMIYNTPEISKVTMQGFSPDKSSTMLMKATAAKFGMNASQAQPRS